MATTKQSTASAENKIFLPFSLVSRLSSVPIVCFSVLYSGFLKFGGGGGGTNGMLNSFENIIIEYFKFCQTFSPAWLPQIV